MYAWRCTAPPPLVPEAFFLWCGYVRVCAVACVLWLFVCAFWLPLQEDHISGALTFFFAVFVVDQSEFLRVPGTYSQ